MVRFLDKNLCVYFTIEYCKGRSGVALCSFDMGALTLTLLADLSQITLLTVLQQVLTGTGYKSVC